LPRSFHSSSFMATFKRSVAACAEFILGSHYWTLCSFL